MHERYNKDQAFANDIAIILIHDSFIYSRNVQRAFIVNTDIWMNESETLTVTGWGSHKVRTPGGNRYYRKQYISVLS